MAPIAALVSAVFNSAKEPMNERRGLPASNAFLTERLRTAGIARDKA